MVHVRITGISRLEKKDIGKRVKGAAKYWNLNKKSNF